MEYAWHCGVKLFQAGRIAEEAKQLMEAEVDRRKEAVSLLEQRVDRNFMDARDGRKELHEKLDRLTMHFDSRLDSLNGEITALMLKLIGDRR